jgi:hypothetical protein
MPAATANSNPGPPDPVEEPRHPLHALTTYELCDYRRELESAIASLGGQAPVPPARDRLRARLYDVIAEQDDRKKLAAHA